MNTENTVGKIEKILESNRGSIQEVEREKIYLDDAKKRNKLLGLEIEMKKVALERNKVALQHERVGSNNDPLSNRGAVSETENERL